MSEEPKQPLTTEEKAQRAAMTQYARAIADQLGETQTQPRNTIWRVLRALGEEHTRELLERTWDTATIRAKLGHLT